MFEHLNRKSAAATIAAVIATMGFGGVALAQTSHPAMPSPASQSQSAGIPTTGNTPASATDVPTAGDKADSATDFPTAGDKADSATDVPTAGDTADNAAATAGAQR